MKPYDLLTTFAAAVNRSNPMAAARAVTAVLLGLLSAPLAVEAQSAQSMSRVGLLSPIRSADAGTNRLQVAFLGALGERGWTEGQNFALEARYAEGRQERFPDLASELAGLHLHVLVAWVTAAAQAAYNATKTIPVVTVYVGDPVQLGFVRSLGRPGGNITGLTFVPAFEVFAKQVSLLNQLSPGASSISVFWNPRNPAHPLILQQIENGTRALGLKFRPLPVSDAEKIDAAFAEVGRERGAALLVVADAMFLISRARLARLAAEQELPAMYGSREYVENGGLASYGPDQVEHARRAAYYVDRILRGAKPADLPMEQPRRMELAINAKTAKGLGLRISPALLLQADYVVE